MLVTFIGNLLRVHRNMLLCTPSLLDVSDCSLEMNSECTEIIIDTDLLLIFICVSYGDMPVIYIHVSTPLLSIQTIWQNSMSSIPLVIFINFQLYTNMMIMRTSNTGMTLASLNLGL